MLSDFGFRSANVFYIVSRSMGLCLETSLILSLQYISHPSSIETVSALSAASIGKEMLIFLVRSLVQELRAAWLRLDSDFSHMNRPLVGTSTPALLSQYSSVKMLKI